MGPKKATDETEVAAIYLTQRGNHFASSEQRKPTWVTLQRKTSKYNSNAHSLFLARAIQKAIKTSRRFEPKISKAI